MVFHRANGVQLVVAGLAIMCMGVITLGNGVYQGSSGSGFCGPSSVCSVFTTPAVPVQLIVGALMMSLGAAALGAGWAYLLGTARPQPTSSPDNQD